MKNQNDLIFSIVGFVVLLIVVGVCIGTRPEPAVPQRPAPVNTSEPQYPSGVAPVMANALPSASGASGGGGGAAMGGGATSSSSPNGEKPRVGAARP